MWVEREVRLWLEHKPIGNILIVLTDGRIAWSEGGDFDWSTTDALPRALAGVLKAEPLWVDLSWARASDQLSADDPRFQQAVARLAAPLHGKSLDEIAGDEVRQHRSTRRIARAATAAIALLAAGALAGAWFSYRGQLRAERNLEQALNGVNVLAKLVAKDMQDDFAAVPVELRLKILREAESVLTNLEAGGERAAIQPSRAATLTEFASSYGVLGKYGEANARVAETIALLTEHARLNPSDIRTAAELAKRHSRRSPAPGQDRRGTRRFERGAGGLCGDRQGLRRNESGNAEAFPLEGEPHGDALEHRPDQRAALRSASSHE